MLRVIPNNAVLGATIEGLDLSRPMSDREFAQVLKADYDKYGKLVKDIGFVPQ